MGFQSTKVYDGFSTCFRQWRADGTHCKYLHGYDISIKVVYEGELDDRNWVVDFGRAKRSPVLIDGMTLKDWMDYMFDHTTVIAVDDPALHEFEKLNESGVIQLRVLPNVGAEQFAKYIYDKMSEWVKEDTNKRCKIVSVEVREHEKNSAIYKP